jgi:hypothetical protein
MINMDENTNLAIKHLSESHDRYFDALNRIVECVPEDYLDWQIHGITASEVYSKIIKLAGEARSPNSSLRRDPDSLAI